MARKTTKTPKGRESDVPAPQAGFLPRILILVFILTYLTIAVGMIADGWIHNHSVIRKLLGFSADGTLPPLFVGAIFAVLGSIMGCGVLDMVSFHKYVAIERDFQSPHIWGYFFAPWLAAILGLIVFALLQSGLLIFSGTSASKEQPTDVANLGFLAIGFLSGFGWYDVTERIRKLVKRMFAESGPRTESDGRGITQRIADAGKDSEASGDTDRVANVGVKDTKRKQHGKKK